VILKIPSGVDSLPLSFRAEFRNAIETPDVTTVLGNPRRSLAARHGASRKPRTRRSKDAEIGEARHGLLPTHHEEFRSVSSIQTSLELIWIGGDRSRRLCRRVSETKTVDRQRDHDCASTALTVHITPVGGGGRDLGVGRKV